MPGAPDRDKTRGVDFLEAWNNSILSKRAFEKLGSLYRSRRELSRSAFLSRSQISVNDLYSSEGSIGLNFKREGCEETLGLNEIRNYLVVIYILRFALKLFWKRLSTISSSETFSSQNLHVPRDKQDKDYTHHSFLSDFFGGFDGYTNRRNPLHL